MNEKTLQRGAELLEQSAGAHMTRRKVVATGVKVAYAAPLVAASFKLAGGSALAETWEWMDILTLEEQGIFVGEDKPCKVVVCHATCSESGGNTHAGYSAIEIPSGCDETPEEALAAHLASPQHQNGCQDGRTDVLPQQVNGEQALCPGVGGVTG